MKKHWRPVLLVSLTLIFTALSLWMHRLDHFFLWLLPDDTPSVYDRVGFVKMIGEHLILVASSSFAAVLIGIACGIFVTRRVGRDFLPVVNTLSSLGQTFPPVAVLALAVPLVGFGAKPTIIALFLYGLLPVIRNTIAGLQSVPSSILEAARGMGMNGTQILLQVELPLARRVIFAGIRTSTIINIGTATLGATIGAGGLGAPIIAGLIADNQAFVLQGTMLVGLFAVIVDLLFETIENGLEPHGFESRSKQTA